MPKDLKNAIDNIESSEKESAILLSKMDRLKEIIEKQKRVLIEHENIIEEQKIKIARMYDIPEDVLELKELVGTQRAMLNQRENEIEMAKGEVLAILKELEFLKKQNIPTQRKLEEGFELIGNLKTELAEKKSELLLKEGTVKSLQNKVQEIQAFTDKLQEEQVKMLSDMDQKWIKELEKLRLEHIEEKKDLVSKISDLDIFLLDSKLTSTEATSEAKDLKSRFKQIRDSQENMINKLEDANDKKREADEKVIELNKEKEELNKEMEELKIFIKNNVNKITYYDKLTDLMEHEAQFKAFLIVEQVGSMTLEDLRNALGSPIVLVKKMVQNLQKVDLFEIDDTGKISVKDKESP